jgi:hypothetical protein
MAKCDLCGGTGWYGDQGPGMAGNSEYQPCEQCRPCRAECYRCGTPRLSVCHCGMQMGPKAVNRTCSRCGYVFPTDKMIVITQQSCYGEVKQTIATTVERARRLAASKWRVSDYPLITYQGFIERSQCGAPLGDGAFHPRSPGRFNSCSLDPSDNNGLFEQNKGGACHE